MEVDHGSEIVVPTESFESVIHPSMPINSRKMIVDPSIEAKQTFEIFPEPTDMKSGTPIDFVIHETPGFFLDTSSIYVDVKLKLNDARPGGERVDNRALYAGYFINNLCSSMWKTVKVSLNNTNIESNFHNTQLARLNHLLTTPDEVTKMRGYPQGVFPIKNDSSTLEIGDPHMAEERIKDRIKFAIQDTVHVRGPLNLDVAGLNAFLLDGVNMKVSLEPINPRYLINKKSDDVTVLDYELLSVKLIVCKIKPAPSVLLATKKALLQRPIEYVMRRKIIDTPIIPAGALESTTTRPFQELIPAQIYVWFVDLEASNGTYHLDPYFWHTLDIVNYTVRVNGVEIAGASCADSFIQPYLESFEASGNREHFIPYLRYNGRGCCVLCFNTNNGSDQNSINLERKGNLTIQFKFKYALPRAVKMYIAGAIDSTFIIDSEKQVITNYQF